MSANWRRREGEKQVHEQAGPQHTRRFVEIDPVLPKVGRDFLRIPREDHTEQYTLLDVASEEKLLFTESCGQSPGSFPYIVAFAR